MRQAFIDTCAELISRDPNIYLLTADLGFMAFEDLQKRFPKNFVNIGVAEANMVGVASGLAKCGKRVIIYSMIPFVTMRCLEQIRVCLCMTRANVVIVGVGAGYCYGSQGPSHHCIEDIGIMTALPNMSVFSPADAWEVEKGLKSLMRREGPSYVRLGKSGEPLLHRRTDKFVFGQWSCMRKGKDIAIFATGEILATCLNVARKLEREGISATVFSAHALKPTDASAIKTVSLQTGYVFTVEKNSPWGGLGSIVAHVLAREQIPLKGFYSFALADAFHNTAGESKYLEEKDGLGEEAMLAIIRRIFKKGNRK